MARVSQSVRTGQLGAHYTVGIEEELFLVDIADWDCVPAMPEAFHSDLKDALGSRVTREIISSMVELVSTPHTSLDAAAREMGQLRTGLGQVAQRHGLAVVAAGTHPFASWRAQSLTPKARYKTVADTLGSLSKRAHVCGLHIHVEVKDAELRIDLMNRIQPFLPVLLALSTSSPFWHGAPTGLKGYRSAINDETPRSGLPGRFDGQQEFELYVKKLTAAGVIPDQSFLWWAIRPSLRYPTLELRVADCCTRAEDTFAIAAFYLCLLRYLARACDIGNDAAHHHRLVTEENRWQAIRSGLDAHFIDPASGTSSPMRDVVRGFVELLSGDAEAYGCVSELRSLEAILERGTSADRQLHIFAEETARGAPSAEAVRTVTADLAALTLGS